MGKFLQHLQKSISDDSHKSYLIRITESSSTWINFPVSHIVINNWYFF